MPHPSKLLAAKKAAEVAAGGSGGGGAEDLYGRFTTWWASPLHVANQRGPEERVRAFAEAMEAAVPA